MGVSDLKQYKVIESLLLCVLWIVLLLLVVFVVCLYVQLYKVLVSVFWIEVMLLLFWFWMGGSVVWSLLLIVVFGVGLGVVFFCCWVELVDGVLDVCLMMYCCCVLVVQLWLDQVEVVDLQCDFCYGICFKINGYVMLGFYFGYFCLQGGGRGFVLVIDCMCVFVLLVNDGSILLFSLDWLQVLLDVLCKVVVLVLWQ